MIIGVPKEIKTQEFRVGMTPGSVRELTARGHSVLLECGAGCASGFTDAQYRAAGALLCPDAASLFARADLIVKVKEPQPVECARLRPEQMLFTYLHLAPDRAQTEALMQSRAVCIAYETVTDSKGGLPLLAPMSEVAGRMAIQAGAMALEKRQGGAGILLSGVPGVAPARVLILGGGVVGSNAARLALGCRADITLLDNNLANLRRLDSEFQGRVRLLYSTTDSIEQQVPQADLLIGCVLIPGAAAPRLVSEPLIRRMRPGAAIVDVAIDQGGCIATSRPTTHSHPTFLMHEVVHYCVANMPGAVAHTSTLALNNATLPFIIMLAELGYRQAMRRDPHLKQGLNVCQGQLTCAQVARAHQLPYCDPDLLL